MAHDETTARRVRRSLRLASLLALLQYCAHAFLFLSARPTHGAAEAAVIDAMKGHRFEFSGLTRSYWDFYFGYGLLAILWGLVEIVLLWQLPCPSPKLVRSRILDLSETRQMLPNLMLRLARLLLGVVRSLFLRRADLLLENLALRQQLAVLVHSGRRPRIGGADRIFWMILSRWWSRWSDTLAFVKPETVVQ